MTDTATSTDMGIGMAMAFGAVALAGAAVMYLAAANQQYAGAGFAAAVIAGGLSIGALHVYGGD